MKLVRLLVLLALAASFITVCSNAAPPNVMDANGYKVNAKTGALVDASGNAKVVDADRDRDLSAVTGLVTANTILPGTTRGGISALPVSSFTRMGLMLRWTFAAAADSDSVNIIVKIYAKRSATLDDGANHLWIPSAGGTAADTSRIQSASADSANVYYVPASYYVTRNRSPKLQTLGPIVGNGAVGPFRASSMIVPVRIWRWAGNGGVYIPLGDAGLPFNAQYVGIEVTNAHISKSLDTFTAELWPKVN